jgi:phosphatidylglycerol---prolipoprotein diacylglyceryl transferase
VRPILFDIGSFPLHTFGLMVGLGFMLGLWAASKNCRRIGLDPALPYDLSTWFILGGIGGARILYVLSYWDRDFAGEPISEVFAIWKGGLVFYGGLIGATLLGIIAILRRRLPLWHVADALAPGIALGHVFGRMGCLLNGCCFGRESHLPWAITYPYGHATFHEGAASATPVHPAPVYEALLNFLFFLGLMLLFRRRSFAGQVFAVYIIGYAFIRTFCELFRGDYSVKSDPLHGILTPGQLTSAFTVLVGLGLFFWLRRYKLASSPIRVS